MTPKISDSHTPGRMTIIYEKEEHDYHQSGHLRAAATTVVSGENGLLGSGIYNCPAVFFPALQESPGRDSPGFCLFVNTISGEY
jgi:hypothetical protein